MRVLVTLLAIQWCCVRLCGRKCCGDYERVETHEQEIASDIRTGIPEGDYSMPRWSKADTETMKVPRQSTKPKVRMSPRRTIINDQPQLVAVEAYDPRLIQVEGFETRRKITESTSDDESMYSKAPDVSPRSSPQIFLHKRGSSMPAQNLAFLRPLPTPTQGEFENPSFLAPPVRHDNQYQPSSKSNLPSTYQPSHGPSQKSPYLPSMHQPSQKSVYQPSHYKSTHQPSQKSILRSSTAQQSTQPVITHHSSPTGTIYTSPRSQAKSQSSPPPVPQRMVLVHHPRSHHSSRHSPPPPIPKHTTTPQRVTSPPKSRPSSYPTIVSPRSQQKTVSQHSSQHNLSQHGRTSHKSSREPIVKSRRSSRSSRGSRNPRSVPWMTVTPASTDQLSQLSPNFEQTSGAQPLQYTTSATGAFNTAEEFHSGQDTELCGRNSESMFLPRGYSGSSVNVSTGRTNHSAFEVISVSSSCQVEGGSEYSVSGVLEALL